MNQGKEASLVQREVAANAAGGIGGVPPLSFLSPGGEPPRPFLSPVGMRCSAYCSGCDKPSPGRGYHAILAKCIEKSSPVKGGFSFIIYNGSGCYCPAQQRSGVRTSLVHTTSLSVALGQDSRAAFPGCGEPSPGAQEQTAHTAFSEFWVQRHAAEGKTVS